MTETARYCARCGGAVEVRTVDCRPREVCTRCDRVYYRNPLPVAACVVLTNAREVLLIKRRNEPHRGMWCLPGGFAERNETIDQAALRELEEEAGIEGRVVCLLAAESLQTEFYGDLLFVIFEVAKIDGIECAGDDAEEFAYFPIEDIPRLAFAPHVSAIEACANMHREAWAIQDSFGRLQADDRRNMLSDALVTLVRDNAEEISHRWLSVVREKPSLPTYSQFDSETVRANALAALRRFQTWLAGEIPDKEVRAYFRAVGSARRTQGYPLPEVLSALSLLRREIWTFARESLVPQRVLDVYRVMELDRRTVLFFDKAHYQIACGYEEASEGAGQSASA